MFTNICVFSKKKQPKKKLLIIKHGLCDIIDIVMVDFRETEGKGVTFPCVQY